MALNLLSVLDKIYSATSGKTARSPIITGLNSVNNSVDNAYSLTDGEKDYMYTEFHSPASAYKVFKNGDHYTTKVTDDFYEGKKALVGDALYTHLEKLDKILAKIIDGEAVPNGDDT